MYLIYVFGQEELKKCLLLKLVLGELVGCFGLMELNYGFDLVGMEICVKKVDGGYLVSGFKIWIINLLIVDVCVVWVKFDGKVIGFVIECEGVKGLEILKIFGKFLLCVFDIGFIFMDDVFVFDVNKLDVEGLKGLFSCLNKVCFGISWGFLGVVEFCWYVVCNYILEC